MVVHKMIISVMDNGQIEVFGIPENLESALFLIHNLTRVVIGYHLDRVIKLSAILQNHTSESKLALLN